jgi:MFS family permease
MSYFFRSVNAVIAPNLIADMSLSNTDLGLLTSAYFLSFAAFQIPLGILLDRFGPTRVQSALLATAACGAFIFATGDTKTTLFIGRALIGLGVSGGLMSSFKAIVLWFPRERLPLVNGLFMSFGGLGALSATAPVEFALGFSDWRGVYAAIGVATICVSAVILLITPDKPEARTSASFLDQIKGLQSVYQDRLFWRVAPLTFTAASAGLAIQSLWIGPWLKNVELLGRQEIANQLFLVALAMTVGFSAMGITADIAYKKWGIRPQAVMVWGNILFLVVQIGIIIETVSINPPLWVLFGFLSNFSALAFAVLSQHFPTDKSAVSNTGLNLFVFGMAFLGQYAIGAIVDLFPVTDAGNPIPDAYRAAFGVIALCQIIAVAWYFLSPKLFSGKEAQALDS